LTNLAALLGSRICHDLINPLGAISNGIELLGLSGQPRTPEMDLLEESVASATSRLQLLRYAFGDATNGQTVPRADILQTLQDAAHDRRHSYFWDAEGDPPRTDVRLVFLAVMCVETALPLGGDIRISFENGTWFIDGQDDRLTLDPSLWTPLEKGQCPDPLAAAQVHFGMLAELSNAADRSLALSQGANWVRIAL